MPTPGRLRQEGSEFEALSQKYNDNENMDIGLVEWLKQ
jgi:hypothetical protein